MSSESYSKKVILYLFNKQVICQICSWSQGSMNQVINRLYSWSKRFIGYSISNWIMTCPREVRESWNLFLNEVIIKFGLEVSDLSNTLSKLVIYRIASSTWAYIKFVQKPIDLSWPWWFTRNVHEPNDLLGLLFNQVIIDLLKKQMINQYILEPSDLSNCT